MKTKTLFAVCTALLMVACSQKQSVVQVPVSTIDVEHLNGDIDYNMDVTGLSLGDLRVLRHAPAARQGFPFKDAYLRGVYETTTWYDSLVWKFDESLDFSSVKERGDESWRDYYYRATDELKVLKYTPEEEAFMERLKLREDELQKLNFDADEGLRVNVGNLVNPTQLKVFDSLLCQQLARDGFAIVPATHNQLFHIYEQNDYSNFPSFVTTDLFLQLYHLYFDCMLRELEEHALDSLMIDFTYDMYINMHAQAMKGETPLLRQLSHHNAVYFSIAYELLTGKPIGHPDEREEAEKEVAKVMKSENAFSDFIGEYQEVEFPYSLFRPRGHYTRSEQLQRYFRGMMWLQSVPFGLDSPEQVQLAAVMADELNRHEPVQRTYQRVNQLMNYLMGQPDNLSIPQVQAELQKAGKPLAELLESEADMAKLKSALNVIAEQQTRIRPKYEYTSHNKVCLMPQRYQPDAEVLQEMVDYDSKPTTRPTPKGLDFFAAMGVSAAEQILKEEGQKWKDFGSQLTKMKQRMGEIEWQETIATMWMQALKTVNNKDGQVPYFMATPEWELKNLNASLGSWAELKHDAILYAKQPMGAECGGGGVPDPVVQGYVEPNVGFWKKAIELLENTIKLLKDQRMMTEKVDNATERIGETARFLLRVSEKELAGQPLTDEELDQLKCVGATFENISLDLVRQPDQFLMGWDDVQGTDRKVALVADVYTANADNNPDKSILYEAIGAADEIYVVVEVGGYLYLMRGAVLSYREFTQPLGQQRLTDEEWQQELEKNPRKGVPGWMERIIVPLKQKPVANEESFYSSGC
jgi:hypothetical protein